MNSKALTLRIYSDTTTYVLTEMAEADAAQRAKITEKVHKPPRNHYKWPVFSDFGLNCESQGEKGRTCKRYKILIGS